MATILTQDKLHPSRIDLPDNVRIQVIDALNHTLGNLIDLRTQVKQAHWNVKGMHFIQLHELFDELAEELIGFVDTAAERVTTLGGTAYGTARMAINESELPEYPADIYEGQDHVTALADRYGIVARLVRQGIDKADDLGDKDSADLFTEISRAIDLRLWFLEAHIQV